MIKHVKQGNRTGVYGDGILDIDYPCTSDVLTFKAYKVWGSMFTRCHSKVGQKHNPAYHDCSICEEWKRFSVFLEWFKQNYESGYALDKDILIKGNKVYSPTACCFVPTEINSLLTNRRNKRKGLLGTAKTRNNTFQAHVSRDGKIVHLGSFKTEEEAFYAYKQAKESYVKEVAERYYSQGRITEKVYNALMNYKIEITD